MTEAPCVLCGESIEPDELSLDVLWVDGIARATHRGCVALSIVGHSHGICRCTNYDGAISMRHAALKLDVLFGHPYGKLEAYLAAHPTLQVSNVPCELTAGPKN
mgnify:CR=1 FL=1